MDPSQVMSLMLSCCSKLSVQAGLGPTKCPRETESAISAPHPVNLRAILAIIRSTHVIPRLTAESSSGTRSPPYVANGNKMRQSIERGMSLRAEIDCDITRDESSLLARGCKGLASYKCSQEPVALCRAFCHLSRECTTLASAA